MPHTKTASAMRSYRRSGTKAAAAVRRTPIAAYMSCPLAVLKAVGRPLACAYLMADGAVAE